jgi:hypothetical protein
LIRSGAPQTGLEPRGRNFDPVDFVFQLLRCAKATVQWSQGVDDPRRKTRNLLCVASRVQLQPRRVLAKRARGRYLPRAPDPRSLIVCNALPLAGRNNRSDFSIDLKSTGHGVDKPSRWQSGDQSDQRFVVVVVVSVATGAGTE